MSCPECSYPMETIDVDDRQEWCHTTYYCKECNKSFLRRTIYQTQSSLVASDELEEIEEEKKVKR